MYDFAPLRNLLRLLFTQFRRSGVRGIFGFALKLANFSKNCLEKLCRRYISRDLPPFELFAHKP